jgi:hypothetical protein
MRPGPLKTFEESMRMAATFAESPTRLRFPRQPWLWVLAPLVAFVAVLSLLSWWFTEPLVDKTPTPALTHAPAPVSASKPEPRAWPAEHLEGEPAKRLLLQVLRTAAERIAAVKGYTATFRKQERIQGKLGPETTMEMKVRHQPFAVYLKYLNPQAGKEVVYAEGRYGNKVIGHNAGWTRQLLPRLAVPPTHPLALAESRHPITEAGLANLIRKLIHFRELDLADPEAVTILDRATGPNGQPVLRSFHEHPHYQPDRPFARVEVLYDPETFLPIQITSFDWPSPDDPGHFPLAERYTYENLNLDAKLSDLDFDPANPAYAFHRF